MSDVHQGFQSDTEGMFLYNTGILGKKLLIRILVFSFFVTLVTSTTVIYSDYREQIRAQDIAIDQIQKGYLDSISLSLWEYDTGQIELQLGGVINFPSVIFARVISDGGLEASKGERSNSNLIRQFTYRLQYASSNSVHSVGVLEVIVDQGEIYALLYKKAIVIIITQFLKTLVVSLFILFLVNDLITRHLNDMADWADELDINQLDSELILNRKETNDEISNVVNAINKLRENLIKGINEKNTAQKELKTVNAELENRVNERTSELLSAVERLNGTIDELKQTQNQLVEAEKMASLGQMVAGVAHELNTPLGICITTQSHLSKVVRNLATDAEMDNATREKILGYVTSLNEGLRMLEDSLFRSSDLVSNFKKLAIDRSQQISTEFSLVELVKRVEQHMAVEISEHRCHIKLLYAKDIVITSYPEPLQNVLIQLIQNSIAHGYSNQEGTVIISLIESKFTVTIDYRDDGIGIPEDIRLKIFEPFVTTSRSKGRSGLGMHMVFNLVTQILDGDIHCPRAVKGAHFSIELPKKIIASY